MKIYIAERGLRASMAENMRDKRILANHFETVLGVESAKQNVCGIYQIWEAFAKEL